jgi:hypothetical protein
MKVIAQAEVPPKAPFAHLGYLAAHLFKQGIRPESAAGLVGMLLAGSMLLALVAAAVVPARYRRKVGLGSRLSLAILVPVLLAGIVGGVALAMHGARAAVRGDSVNRERMERVAYALGRHLLAGNPLPQGMAAIREEVGLSDAQLRDKWGRPFRVGDAPENEYFCQYAVFSAGRDGRFGTLDDLHFFVDLEYIKDVPDEYPREE